MCLPGLLYGRLEHLPVGGPGGSGQVGASGKECLSDDDADSRLQVVAGLPAINSCNHGHEEGTSTGATGGKTHRHGAMFHVKPLPVSVIASRYSK